MTDINLQTLTPDTTLPTTGFLFGADSQASGSPSVFTVQSVATTLLGSTALTGATITADAPVLNLAQTWNNAAVTFTGLKLNATDTASAAGSLLMDWQVGGSTRFNVRKDGQIVTQGGISAQGALLTTSYLQADAAAGVWLRNAAGELAFGNPSDLKLTRDAANTLAQRNGVNAQAFRVYNTFTDASNYERFETLWSANVLYLINTAAGTGAARELVVGTNVNSTLTLRTNTTNRWQIPGATGHLLAALDDTYDIGNTSTNRPRSINISNSLVAGSVVASNHLWITDGITAPTATAGRAKIYVDIADGDLKVIFADGTVKTIVTDT